MKNKLGDICSFQSGGTPSKANADYYCGDIPWITTVALNGQTIGKTAAVDWITEKAIEESAAKIVPARSIMVGTRVGVGKVAINEVPMSTNQDIISLVGVNESLWSKEYICKLIQSKETYLKSQARGATIKGIKIDVLASLDIPDVPLDLQQEIVAVLDKVQSILVARRLQLSALDDLIKARFVEMFGDPLLNPKNWQEKKLEEIADIVSGITKGRKVQSADLYEVPYMAVSNVKDGYIDWTTVKTILATKAEIKQFRLLPNDVLMTEGGDPDKLGRGAIIHEPPSDCIHQNHIFRVRLDQSKITPEFMGQYLQHQKAKRYFLGCAKQTTGIASINMKQLRALPMLMPPIGLQREFASFVAQIDKSKSAIQKSLDETQILFDSLMQKYFG